MNPFKLAARGLAKSPGFTFVAILTLALGIGLNTAMFSIANALILRPLPLPLSEQLFRLNRTTALDHSASHSAVDAFDLQSDTADFAELAMYCYWGFSVVLPNKPAESWNALRVSPNFFHTLRTQPFLGRDFHADEDQPGKNRVVLISYRLWQSHFAGSRDVVGKVIRLDGDTAEIIGVLPEQYGESNLFDFVQVYRPLGLKPDEKTDRITTQYILIGRYHDRAAQAQAPARFVALAERLTKDFPKEHAGTGLRAVPLDSTRLGDLGHTLVIMLVSLSCFVLLIACSNLANLLLARVVSRSREFAICAALGSSRWQLMRPVAAECALLAIMGGVGGLLICRATTAWMSWRFGSDVSPFIIPLDWRVLVFCGVGAAVTSLIFGLAPAWLVSRLKINNFLKSGSRGTTGDRTHEWFRRILIVAQFSLALVLLTGASAFVAGVTRLVHERSGWNGDGVISGKIGLPPALSETPEKIISFYHAAQTKVGALPGVTDTTVSLGIPSYGFVGPRGYKIEGQPPPVPGHEPMAFFNAVSPEYYRVVGTKILRGRGIENTDTLKAPNVLVINETMARALFPNGEAIGHRLAAVGQKDTDWAEIVGIAEDVQFLDPQKPVTLFQVYEPLQKEAWGYVNFTVKTTPTLAAGPLIQQVRGVFSELAPDLPIQDFMPVPAAIERNFRDFATIDQLLVSFALLGLFLAALGIYGVLARLVAQRESEIGIRMALGAQVRDVIRLIVFAGFRMAVIGVVLGLVGSVILERLLVSAMPRVATASVPVIGFATLLLLGIALLACWLPALKSARVDPLVALRGE